MKLAALASAITLFGISPAQAESYDYAQVISSQPIIKYVTVKTPVQECWEETEYYAVNQNPAGSVGRTIFGAVVGGVIGHQFGSGSGNDAATIAGSLLGAAIGNDTAKRKNMQNPGATQARAVEKCATRYREHQEERINGYRVTYRYHGQKYMTEMPYDPGQKLRVRVDIRPAR